MARRRRYRRNKSTVDMPKPLLFGLVFIGVLIVGSSYSGYIVELGSGFFKLLSNTFFYLLGALLVGGFLWFSYITVRFVQYIIQNSQNVTNDHLKYAYYKVVSQVDGMNDREFEHFVAFVLKYQDLNLTNIDVTSKTNDGGIDIFAKKDGKKIAIQVKHYKIGNNVHRPELQGFVGAYQHLVSEAMVVTSSDFSPGARTYAALFHPELTLIDRAELGEMMTRLPGTGWKDHFKIESEPLSSELSSHTYGTAKT